MSNYALNLQQRIREAAYNKWEAGGWPHGRALDHWLAAERELLATIDNTDLGGAGVVKAAMKMSNVVLFLGAGFSRSIGELPTDLLEKIREHSEVDQDTKDSINKLLFNKADTTAQDFEVLLSIVQRLRSQQLAGRRALPGINDADLLWRKLVAAVARVTYFDYKNSQNWPKRCEKLGNFLRNNAVSAVITTNYDLIVDKPLQTDRQIRNLSQYQFGYPIRDLFWNEGDPKPQERIEWRRDDNSIPIYKLHGCTNWAYCNYCKELDLAATQDDLLALWPLQDQTNRRRCAACESPYEPILVPPVPNKGVMNNPVLAQVWQKAEKALEAARFVIFVGYSLPSADPLVAEMLATARHRSAKVNGERWAFCVIDPCCSAHARYRSVFGSEGRHYLAKFDLDQLEGCCLSERAPFGQATVSM